MPVIVVTASTAKRPASRGATLLTVLLSNLQSPVIAWIGQGAKVPRVTPPNILNLITREEPLPVGGLLDTRTWPTLPLRPFRRPLRGPGSDPSSHMADATLDATTLPPDCGGSPSRWRISKSPAGLRLVRNHPLSIPSTNRGNGRSEKGSDRHQDRLPRHRVQPHLLGQGGVNASRDFGHTSGGRTSGYFRIAAVWSEVQSSPPDIRSVRAHVCFRAARRLPRL